jgi:hypothetical protein
MADKFLDLRPLKKWTAGLARPESPPAEAEEVAATFSSQAWSTSSPQIPWRTLSKWPRRTGKLNNAGLKIWCIRTSFHLPNVDCSVRASNDHEVVEWSPLDSDDWKQMSRSKNDTFSFRQPQDCHRVVAGYTANAFLHARLQGETN